MRNAAIVLIVLSLAALGAILFTQVKNNSTLPRESSNKKILDSPTRKTTLDPPEQASPANRAPAAIEPVSGSIAWEDNLVLATETAKAGNKVIVVDIYTDWCGWCKKMDQIIYSNPRVVGLSRQEVFLKLDAEDGGQGQNFAGEMNVKGYPTTIILDSSGKRIAEKRGFISSPDQFIQFVEGARTAKS